VSWLGKVTPLQAEEILKCMRSFRYWIVNYCYLRTTTGKKLKWDKPYAYQDKFFQAMQDLEDIFVLKSRRIGASWCACAYALWLCMYHPDIVILLLSRKEFYAKRLLTRVKFIYKHLPSWMRPRLGSDSKTEVSFIYKSGDGISESFVFSLTTTDESGRGEDAMLIIMDEAAFIQGADDTWAAVGPSGAYGGQRIVVSCVTEDTFVYTDKGPRRVSEFKYLAKQPGFNQLNEEIYLLGKGGLKRVSHFYDSGETDTVKLELKQGVELECTDKHPIWCRRDGFEGWVQAGDLRVGDYVACGRGSLTFGDEEDLSGFKPKETNWRHKKWLPPERMTTELAYLIGLIVGDGYVGKYVINVTTEDRDIADFLLSEPAGLGFEPEKDGIHYRVCRDHFVQFLEWLGYERVRANRKTIPTKIMGMSQEIVTACLSGLFDADGTQNRRDGNVHFVSSSKKLVEQVNILLFLLGITGSVRYHLSRPTKKVKVSSPQWRLELNSDSRLFYNLIGFRIQRKQDGKENLPENEYNPKDTIPFSTHLVREIRQKLPNLIQPEYAELSKARRRLSGHILWKNDVKPGRKMSYRVARDILLLYAEARARPSHRELTRLCDEHYKWLPVKSIEHGRAHTYDFSIPDGHNYYANGILTHNTPNGVGGFFHRNIMLLQARLSKAFTYLEAHWKRDCGLSDAWYEKATAGLSLQKRLQEFELQFLSTGRPFFDPIKLKECYRPADEFPEIAEMMRRTKFSFSGVDTAEGHSVVEGEPDYHSVTVLNEFGVQIFQFTDNTMSQNQFTGHIAQIGDDLVKMEGVPSKVHREFPGGMAIEQFGPGDVTVAMHTTPDDHGFSWMISHRQTNSGKMRILNSLRLAINELQVVITDPFTYTCFQTFEDQTQGVIEKAGAADGTFDDPVISFALAYMLLKQHGGYQFDFSNLNITSGQRAVGLRREDDLSLADLRKVMPLGRVAQGPMADNVIREHARGFGRMTNDYDDTWNGKHRMRPPGMR